MGRKGAAEARADRFATVAKRLAGGFIPALYRKSPVSARFGAQKTFKFQ
jgi:hypothetical protein